MSTVDRCPVGGVVEAECTPGSVGEHAQRMTWQPKQLCFSVCLVCPHQGATSSVFGKFALEIFLNGVCHIGCEQHYLVDTAVRSDRSLFVNVITLSCQQLHQLNGVITELCLRASEEIVEALQDHGKPEKGWKERRGCDETCSIIKVGCWHLL